MCRRPNFSDDDDDMDMNVFETSEEEEQEEEEEEEQLFYQQEEHDGQTYVAYTPEFSAHAAHVFQNLSMMVMASYSEGDLDVPREWLVALSHAARLYYAHNDLVSRGMVCVHEACQGVFRGMAERCSVYANRVQVSHAAGEKICFASAAAFIALRFARTFLPDQAESLDASMRVLQPFCPESVCDFMQPMDVHQYHDLLCTLGDCMGWDEEGEGGEEGEEGEEGEAGVVN